MKIIKDFKLFESELGYYDDFDPIDDYPKDNTIDKNILDRLTLEEEYIKKLGKEGELLKHIESGEVELTFGMLKSLFNDAIKYKKKREITKGTYKFLHRTVPMALASVSFPVWVISQILGGSRALNKILVPVLRMKSTNYKKFLVNVITKTMDLMEGEIKMFMGNDWFYRVFMVDWGLISMIRKEYIINFSEEISKKMELKPYNEVVPLYYIENELRKYLNEKFNINPGLPLKMSNIEESIDYTKYKKIFKS